ncbi:MAG: ATP-binding cassette domain-containing protein [Burkholderiaceae bacterium]|jgi:lipoprotein-releasing system ATP-binding protein|nr:ATP-binding cassette domain-containing protein [Burkholderiaceae bacterium]
MTDQSVDFALQAKGLCKYYDDGNTRIDVLREVTLDIKRGELVAVIGASGSGKSTLLHALGLLDLPTSGTIRVAGQPSEGLSESARSRLRNRELGFVYQFHHLLPEFTALDNVAMPLIVRRDSRDSARAEALKVLELVGLSARTTHYPGQLSGGERQRVALARALVTRPACVLADEPTGNLDRHTAQQMFKLLKQVNAESRTAFLIVTHDPELAALADRRLYMDAGRLVDAP